MSRLFRPLLMLAIAATLAVPGLAQAKKPARHVIKHKVSLEAGQPLRVDIEGELESCVAGWECWPLITEPKGKELLYGIAMAGDGSWKAYLFEAEADEDEEGGDEGEGEADDEGKVTMKGTDGSDVEVKKVPDHICDGIELVEPEEGWEALGDDWKKLPVLTEEQRRECVTRKTLKGHLTVEKMDGELIEENGQTFFLVPADILPAESFEVTSNGYWGAAVDGEFVGTASRTGVISIQR